MVCLLVLGIGFQSIGLCVLLLLLGLRWGSLFFVQCYARVPTLFESDFPFFFQKSCDFVPPSLVILFAKFLMFCLWSSSIFFSVCTSFGGMLSGAPVCCFCFLCCCVEGIPLLFHVFPEVFHLSAFFAAVWAVCCNFHFAYCFF